ncbi:MAG: hypothetical protein GY860_21065 [Desulfobacteraceae bacterium]|nr:hypothetical protein [Desulfobacteraceae bacterium]
MVDNTEQDDGIIELTQVVDEDSYEEPDQDIIELTDVNTQIEEIKENDLEPSITREQVDSALERVIEKKFAAKIEKILFEVMENVLEKEIADIRKSLQKALDERANS